MWDGAGADESGGCGKWLRAGSYCRLFAKSSKVTSGMKSKRSPASAGASGGWAKLKRAGASLTAGKARPWGAMLAASLVTLQAQLLVSMLSADGACRCERPSHLCFSYGRGPSGTLWSRTDCRRPRKFVFVLVSWGGRGADVTLGALDFRRACSVALVRCSLRTRPSASASAAPHGSARGHRTHAQSGTHPSSRCSLLPSWPC